MTDQKGTEPDMEKIKAELAESACAARQKVAAAAKSYRDAMDNLAQQLTSLKRHG